MYLEETLKYYDAFSYYQNRLYYLYDVSAHLSTMIYTSHPMDIVTTTKYPDITGSVSFKGEYLGKKINESYYVDSTIKSTNVKIISAGEKVKFKDGQTNDVLARWNISGKYMVEQNILGIKYTESLDFSGSGTGDDRLKVHQNKYSHFYASVSTGISLYHIIPEE